MTLHIALLCKGSVMFFAIKCWRCTTQWMVMSFVSLFSKWILSIFKPYCSSISSPSCNRFLIINSFRNVSRLENIACPFWCHFPMSKQKGSLDIISHHDEIAHKPSGGIRWSEAWVHQAEDWIQFLGTLYELFLDIIDHLLWMLLLLSQTDHWMGVGSFFNESFDISCNAWTMQICNILGL